MSLLTQIIVAEKYGLRLDLAHHGTFVYIGDIRTRR